MILDVLTRPEAAVTVSTLISLGGLWVIKTRLLANRITRRKKMEQVAHLRSAAVAELDRLKARSPSLGATHASKAVEFGGRIDGLCRGVKFQKISALEDTCHRLETIRREIFALSEALEGRVVPEATRAMKRPAAQRNAARAVDVECRVGEGSLRVGAT